MDLVVNDMKILASDVNEATGESSPNLGADITSNIITGPALPFTVRPYVDINDQMTFYLEYPASSNYEIDPQVFWVDMSPTIATTHSSNVTITDFTLDKGILAITLDTNVGPGIPPEGGEGGEVPTTGPSTSIETHETGPIIERIDQSRLFLEKFLVPSIIKKGEDAEITVSLTNVGDKIAENVSVVDFVPREFVITQANYTSIRNVLGGYELVWEIDRIDPAIENIIRYKITPLETTMTGNYPLKAASARILGQEKARSNEVTLSLVGEEALRKLRKNYFVEVIKRILDNGIAEYQIVIDITNRGEEEAPEFVLRDYCGPSVRALSPTPDRLPCSWNVQLNAGETTRITYYIPKSIKSIDYPNVLGLEKSKYRVGLSVFTKLELKTPEQRVVEIIQAILGILVLLALIVMVMIMLLRKWRGEPIRPAFTFFKGKWDYVKEVFKV